MALVIERVVGIHKGGRMEAGTVVAGEGSVVNEEGLVRDMKIGQAGMIWDIDHYRRVGEGVLVLSSAGRATERVLEKAGG